MLDKSVIEKISSNTSLALVVIGLILVVIGAAGGWPTPALQVNELGWRIALAIMGVFVAVAGGLFLWREKAPIAPTPSCDAYDIRIVSPRNGEEVSTHYEVSGTYGKKPPKGKIVQLFTVPPGATDPYWPIIETKVSFDVKRKTWHTPAHTGDDPGPRNIVVALIGQAGQALCNYYRRVGEQTGEWPGITTLTPDIVECDRVTVITTASPLPAQHRQEFREDFSQDLGNWDYFGDWRTEREGDRKALIVTNSGSGGIAKPCLSWKDYVFGFETKIVNRNTSWIIRAKDIGNYVMLQCQEERLYPHFRADGKWVNLDWTNRNPVILPFRLPLDAWFSVRIEVRGVQVVVTVTIDGIEKKILDSSSLLEPPTAPASYPMGSVGFRESATECAHFRNVRVMKI